MNSSDDPHQVPPPGGGRSSSSPGDTKSLLLDTAEALFARRGYRATSLRMLTAEAGVNLAAVNYHFGTKEALLKAVFARRLDPLNRLRLERLEAIRSEAEEEGRLPSVENVLRAFIAPMLLLKDAGEGAFTFTTLIGRVLTEHDPPTREIFLEYMKPVFLECHGLLCHALPRLSRKTVFWRLLFATAAASRAMLLEESMAQLDASHARLGDREAILSVLLPFVTAGMEAE